MTRELLTSTNIAEILDVSPRRVQQLAARSDFPKPWAITPPTQRKDGMRLWRRADIERWRPTWHRTPGRPEGFSPAPRRKP